MKILLFLVFSLLSQTQNVFSQTKPASSVEDTSEYQIDVILVDGLFRTQKRIVVRELGFGEGSIVTHQDIEKGIQRVRDLGLFRLVSYALSDQEIIGKKPISGEDPPRVESVTVDPVVGNQALLHRVIRIHVDERWTLLPFWRFNQGGGELSFSAGLVDRNLFGSYISAGFQYNRFSGTNSVSLFVADPRFLDTRLSFSGSLSQRNLTQFVYDDEGTPTDGWLLLRRAVGLNLDYDWTDIFRTGMNVGLAVDDFSSRLIPAEIADLKKGAPKSERLLAISFSASLGQINTRKYLKKGVRYNHWVRLLEPNLGSSFRSLGTSGSLNAFAILPWDINLAGRLAAGIQTTQNENYAYTLGGLGEVRGFFHRRFRGTKYWFANAEMRVPSFDNRYFVIQHIAFIDLANTGFGNDSIFGLEAASTGLGLRIIIPKVIGFIARLDYAIPLKGQGTSVLSFGSQQFF